MVEGNGTQARLLVVILNWNCASDTREAVRSVAASTGVSADCLVVDNGSTDDSLRNLAAWLAPSELVALPTNLGFAGGANQGIAYAMAKGYAYVCLLNADATVTANALAYLLSDLERDPTLGAVAAKILGANTGKIQTAGGGQLNWLTGRVHIAGHQDLPLTFLAGTCLVLRGSALAQVGLLDERFFMYWEDADLCVRLTHGGWKLGYAKDASVLHAGGSALGRASAVAQFQYLTSMVLFFRKHRRVWAIPVGLRLLGSLLERVARRDKAGMMAVVRSCHALFARQVTYAKPEGRAQ